jgi:putative CocE/NonD family hydrolase
MGPWSHGQWGGANETSLGNILFESNTSLWFSEHIEEPFFAYYLKGEGDINQIKEATIFFSGSNQWKQFAQWPPANNEQQALYLEKDGKIEFQKSISNHTTDFAEYISDPAKPVPYAEGIQLKRSGNYMTDDQRFASNRTDVLVYQSAILEENKTIAGPVIADLLVSSSTTDADFVVKLIDVFPDDYQYEKPLPNSYEMGAYQMLVRGDLFRAKFRNSFEKPEPLIPNKPTKVVFALNDAAHTFKKGHRIMVQVQSSWFPLFDRNPQKFTDIYQATKSDYRKANIRLYQNESKILVRVIN